MRSRNIRYLPQVDHLRAVAAIWIVFYHAIFLSGFELPADLLGPAFKNPLYALWVEGHTAVALFMTLSGFIFTVGAFGRDVSYKDFLINRILRIYPLFLAIVLVSMANDREAKSVLRAIVTILPVADIRWEGEASNVPMDWSVAVEFQFYLIFPFLLHFFNRQPVKTTIGVIAAALTFRVIESGLWANPRDLSYWHLVGRIDQFVLGMFAAFLYHRLHGRETFMRVVFIAASLAAILLLWAFATIGGGWSTAGNWKLLWPTVEGGVWSAFILGYVGMRPKLPALLAKTLARIGEMSFSIYLLHVLVLRIINLHPQVRLALSSRWEINLLATTVLEALPLILGMAFITYNVIEKPFLSFRRKYLRDEVPAAEPRTLGERISQPV